MVDRFCNFKNKIIKWGGGLKMQFKYKWCCVRQCQSRPQRKVSGQRAAACRCNEAGRVGIALVSWPELWMMKYHIARKLTMQGELCAALDWVHWPLIYLTSELSLYYPCFPSKCPGRVKYGSISKPLHTRWHPPREGPVRSYGTAIHD